MSWDSDVSGYLAELSRQPGARQPATLGEVWGSEWQRTALDTAGGLGGLYDEARGALVSGIEAASGQGIAAYAASKGVNLGNSLTTGQDYEALGALADTLPEDKRKTIEPLKDIRSNAAKKAQKIEADAAEIGDATYGLSAHATAFLSGIARQSIDPANLVAMAVTAPMGGRGGSLLSIIGREAGANAAAQAMVEPVIQPMRADLGLEAGFGRAVGNILEAGIGGAIIGGGLHLAGRGLRAMRGEAPAEFTSAPARADGAITPPDAVRRASAPDPVPAQAVQPARPVDQFAPDDFHAAGDLADRDLVIDLMSPDATAAGRFDHAAKVDAAAERIDSPAAWRDFDADPLRPAADDRIDPILARSRTLGSPMEIAERWRVDPEGEYQRLQTLRQDVSRVERELMQKYGVRRVDDLDDAPLTDAERNFLFYEKSPTSREDIDAFVDRLQPVDTLDDAAVEIGRAFRDLPEGNRALSGTEQLAVMRLQVLFSEVERLGGDLNEIVKQAGRQYAGRFSDPNDALDMAFDAATRLRQLFGRNEAPPLSAVPIPAEFKRPALPAPKAAAARIPVDPADVVTRELKPKKVRGRAGADPETWSLFEFIASKGGLKPDPELQAVFVAKGGPFVPGFGNLIRKGGATLDDALTSAKEAGYLFDPGDVDGSALSLTIRDILDVLDNEARGQKLYKPGKAKEAAIDEGQEAHAIIGALEKELFETGGGEVRVDNALADRVVQIVRQEKETDLLSAYERAIMEDAERFEALAAARSQNAELGKIEGWDADEPAAASRNGEADPGQRRQAGRTGQAEGRSDGKAPRDAGDGAGASRQLGDPALAADAQRVLDEAGDIDITLISPDGSTRTVKASDALREVEEDAAAADALNACIAGAAEEFPF